MCNVAGEGDVECGGERKRLRGYVLTLMWNMLGNGGVECGGERLREIWWRTLMWNAPENVDVGMWRRTLMWNAPENGDGAQCVIL